MENSIQHISSNKITLPLETQITLERKRISKLSKHERIPCSCFTCQEQCHQPCLGTPKEILRLIKEGYKEHIKPTIWVAGIFMRVCDHEVYMFQLEPNEQTGYCSMAYRSETGKVLCKLHNLGLKPTEGMLSGHTKSITDYCPNENNLTWLVAKTWEAEENQLIIEQIAKELGLL